MRRSRSTRKRPLDGSNGEGSSSSTKREKKDNPVGPVHTLRGSLPPLLDSGYPYSYLDDEQNGIFLGMGSSRENEPPQIWHLDLIEKTWRNVMSDIEHADAPKLSKGGPKFSDICAHRPAFCATKTSGGRFLILLFGGIDLRSGEVKNNLIAIDPKRGIWFEIHLAGNALGRAHATMVADEERLYVFGGFHTYDNQSSKVGEPHQSYSVAVLEDHACRWDCLDIPFPQHIMPEGTLLDEAIWIQGSKKIFLGPGREIAESTYTLSPHTAFLFDSVSRSFTSIDQPGLPHNLVGYCSGSQSHLRIDTVKWHSILICGWNTADPSWGIRDALVPDLWRIYLEPLQGVVKMNIGVEISKHVAKSKMVVRTVVYHPDHGRLLFLGSGSTSTSWDRILEYPIPKNPF